MAEAIGKHRKVVTIILGTEMPMALTGMENAYYVPTSLHLQKRGLKRAVHLLEELDFLSKISVVHAYDAKSVYIGASIAKKIGAKFLLTKCGGRVLKRKYPKVNSLIVFHEMDYHYYNNHKDYYNNVYLVPNRVRNTIYNENRIQQLEDIREKTSLNILKIGRIGKYYYKTLTDTIRFCSDLSKSNYQIKLTFVGYEESPDIIRKLNILAQELNVNLTTYSDSAYTLNASELIWACDVAIGTGRGAMEALSAGRILLFPVANFDYPCLLNKETATYAMSDNFSERVILPEELSQYCDPHYVMTLLSDNTYVENLKSFGLGLFNSDFNVDVGAKKVINIYNENHTSKSMTRWSLFRLRLQDTVTYYKFKLKIFRRNLRAILKKKYYN
ncbi:hypothetical protein ACTXGO_07025 [Psychrobacter sp. T6-1]|uniref:hypothetical protein n=1 Tax=Psychrobacter sp. T6-1 TaxID=3457447 RepID=UPI003FD53F8F